MAKRDYYAVLGIERSASDDEIKRAFRELARKYHPDVNKDAGAQERFVEIQEAYAVLSDPEKRGAYDRFGHTGVNAPAGGGYDVDFQAEDLGSMFDAFFGGRNRSPFGTSTTSARPGRRPKPADTRHDIQVDFVDAALGGNRSLEIKRGGSAQNVDVTIPAGVQEGAKLRVRGVGHADPSSPGKRGDLILTVHILPHPIFRRGVEARNEKPADVYFDLPISIAEAVYGAKIRVPTPSGEATLSIPPGAGSGRKLRLRGQGCQSTPPGDLYAVLMIQPPTDPDEADREAIDRLGGATVIRTGQHWPEQPPADPA